MNIERKNMKDKLLQLIDKLHNELETEVVGTVHDWYVYDKTEVDEMIQEIKDFIDKRREIDTFQNIIRRSN